MSATFGQLLILFFFVGCGFCIGKIKKISAEKNSVLSIFLVNVFLPCKIFSNFSERCTVSYFKNNYRTLLISVGLLIFLVALAFPISKLLTKNPYERKVYRYSISISNYAYLGYVLVEALFGEEVLTDMILFCLPFSIYTYTFGYSLLTSERHVVKRLISPMTIAIVLGMVFGMAEIPLANGVRTALNCASACVGPLSMILTGSVFASFALREILPNGRTMAFSALRLILIPALIFLICLLLELFMDLPKAVCFSAVMMACMPCGLNTIVFSTLAGENSRTGARTVLATHILCLITIPVWVWIMM